MIRRNGIEEALQGFAVQKTVVMAALDVLAFSFYKSQVPEKWWPHLFDIWVRKPLSLAFSGKLTRVF